MTMRIVAVTGGRADYGLLSPVLSRLRDEARFDLRIMATGQHLSSGSGDTLGQIAADGLDVCRHIEILLASDSPVSVGKSTGLAVIGFADALSEAAPDLVLLLGDRYEIFAVAVAAYIQRIPIAHIAGGDVTEGAIDEGLRHAITKLSHVHFATTEEAARRLRQLGENPDHIHVVGSPGLDHIGTAAIPDRDTFFRAVGMPKRGRNIVVTFHPPTAGGNPERETAEMLAALDAVGPDVGLIFTGVNADTSGRVVEASIRRFVQAKDNASFHGALGRDLYFGALTHCDVVVGNSSSGLYEAPSFGIPTVNIGMRQAGRIRATSVIDVDPVCGDILSAIRRAFDMDCRGVENPYGDGHASERIARVLASLKNPRELLLKRFHDFGI